MKRATDTMTTLEGWVEALKSDAGHPKVLAGRDFDGDVFVWADECWFGLSCGVCVAPEHESVVLCDNEAEFARWLLEGK